MISLPNLGKSVGLGNAMFQYAYLRTMANRLKVQFYCRSWQGDLIFDFNDQNERAKKPEGITQIMENNFVESNNVKKYSVSQSREVHITLVGAGLSI